MQGSGKVRGGHGGGLSDPIALGAQGGGKERSAVNRHQVHGGGGKSGSGDARGCGQRRKWQRDSKSIRQRGLQHDFVIFWHQVQVAAEAQLEEGVAWDNTHNMVVLTAVRTESDAQEGRSVGLVHTGGKHDCLRQIAEKEVFARMRE